MVWFYYWLRGEASFNIGFVGNKLQPVSTAINNKGTRREDARQDRHFVSSACNFGEVRSLQGAIYNRAFSDESDTSASYSDLHFLPRFMLKPGLIYPGCLSALVYYLFLVKRSLGKTFWSRKGKATEDQRNPYRPNHKGHNFFSPLIDSWTIRLSRNR